MISITAIVFLLLFFAGSLAAIFINPAYGIYLYVFVYFLDPPGRWWWGDLPQWRFALIIGIITLVGYLIHHDKYSENKIFNVPQTKWLVLIGILMVLTWPIAVSEFYHKMFLIIFLKYLVLYLLILKTIDTPQKFERMIWVFLFGQFYFGWMAYTTGRTDKGRTEHIGGSDSGDANVTAAVMVVAVPILINYLVRGKKWEKICAFSILVFVLNALVLINSRGSLIAIIVSIGYYLYLSLSTPSFLQAKKLQISLVITGCVLVFIYLGDTIFWERMSTIVNTTATSSSHVGFDTGRSRISFWFKTFDMVNDHPLGLGAQGFAVMSPQYLPPEHLSPGTNTRAAHSMYFQALAEYGYHGLFLFMAFLYSNFRYTRKIRISLIKRNISRQSMPGLLPSAIRSKPSEISFSPNSPFLLAYFTSKSSIGWQLFLRPMETIILRSLND